MDIGCHLPNQGPLATGEALVRFCREAEQRAVASLWVSDHVIFPRTATGSYPGGRFPHPPDKPYLEPVTVLAAAAVCTTRARLGASVFILGHRHPVVMAKMLTSIDALSNGRLICGVGVGWWKEELETLGVPFHARGRHGDEILRAFKALWTEENPRLDGEFFRFRDLGFAPKPVQKPHPPIWVGGHGRASLRRAAEIGAAWHPINRSPEELRAGRVELARLCQARGRAVPPAIALRNDLCVLRPGRAAGTSVRGGSVLVGEPAALVERIAELAGCGVEHLVIEFLAADGPELDEQMALFAERIWPKLA